MGREKKDGTCIITMTESDIKDNMQTDDSAFESRAVLKKVKENSLEILLDVDKNALRSIEEYIDTLKVENKDKRNEHVGRFLYRAMKFRDSYCEWFKVSKKLNNQVECFKKIFSNEEGDKRIVFSNILDMSGEAGIKNDDKSKPLENWVEAYLADTPKGKEKLYTMLNNKELMSCETQDVYRQLPVCMFLQKISVPTRIIVGTKAAIDLWTPGNNDTLSIIELKTDNPMLGIITELFFYANYMYDVMCFKNIKLSHASVRNNTRGREFICNNQGNIKKINAIMLADSYYSEIDNKVLQVLNDNKLAGKIKYYKRTYPDDIITNAKKYATNKLNENKKYK